MGRSARNEWGLAKTPFLKTIITAYYGNHSKLSFFVMESLPTPLRFNRKLPVDENSEIQLFI
jgi:hypothetical protein